MLFHYQYLPSLFCATHYSMWLPMGGVGHYWIGDHVERCTCISATQCDSPWEGWARGMLHPWMVNHIEICICISATQCDSPWEGWIREMWHPWIRIVLINVFASNTQARVDTQIRVLQSKIAQPAQSLGVHKRCFICTLLYMSCFSMLSCHSKCLYSKYVTINQTCWHTVCDEYGKAINRCLMSMLKCAWYIKWIKKSSACLKQLVSWLAQTTQSDIMFVVNGARTVKGASI